MTHDTVSDIRHFRESMRGYNKGDVSEFIIKQMNDYRRAVADMQDSLNEKSRIIENKISEAANLAETNLKLTVELDTLRTKLKGADERIIVLQNEVDSQSKFEENDEKLAEVNFKLTVELETLRTKLKEADEQIAVLQSETDSQSKFKEDDTKLTEALHTIERLTAEKKSSEARIRELNQKLESVKAEVSQNKETAVKYESTEDRYTTANLGKIITTAENVAEVITAEAKITAADILSKAKNRHLEIVEQHENKITTIKNKNNLLMSDYMNLIEAYEGLTQNFSEKLKNIFEDLEKLNEGLQ